MKDKFFPEYSQYFSDIGLLYELSPYIQNFFPKFKSKLKNTFVLSPMGSSLFGLQFHDGVAYLGVSKIHFRYIDNLSIYSCALIEKESALNIVFSMGTENNNKKVAIRIWKPPHAIKELLEYNNLQIIPMNNNGSVNDNELILNIDCDIKMSEDRFWE